MSAPRGKADGFSVPKIEKPYEVWSPRAAVQHPRDEFIAQVLDDGNPIMGEAFEAACQTLGYEPVLPVACDLAYIEAALQYDLVLDELKALAVA